MCVSVCFYVCVCFVVNICVYVLHMLWYVLYFCMRFMCSRLRGVRVFMCCLCLACFTMFAYDLHMCLYVVAYSFACVSHVIVLLCMFIVRCSQVFSLLRMLLNLCRMCV